MTYLKAFAAGFVATLVFHQGLLAILHAAGISPRGAWSMARTPPLGVPAVVSLAFWGGVWGILAWLVIARMTGASYWATALVFGALLPSLVAWFVVMPMKGMGPAGGWSPPIIVGALLLNGAWGIGVALLMRLMNRAGS
jgi:hypothetical protein